MSVAIERKHLNAHPSCCRNLSHWQKNQSLGNIQTWPADSIASPNLHASKHFNASKDKTAAYVRLSAGWWILPSVILGAVGWYHLLVWAF